MRIVENVHIYSEVISDIVDELIESSAPALDEIHAHEESISDVQDALAESGTLALDEIHVHDESINDIHDALVEFSIPSHDVRCSLSTPTIQEDIEHEIVAIGVDTSERVFSYCLPGYS